jgi:NADH:ubiquinone reductase (H+-translocating)
MMMRQDQDDTMVKDLRPRMGSGLPDQSPAANETAPSHPNAGRGAEALHRIVVVGGGAAGLELVTRLGDRLGRRGRARVALVETARTHLWKPLLHEVAAGSIDPGEY